MILKINDSFLLHHISKGIYVYSDNEYAELKKNLYQLVIEKIEDDIKLEAYISKSNSNNYNKVEMLLDDNFTLKEANCTCDNGYRSLCYHGALLIRYINMSRFPIPYSKVTKEELGELTLDEYREIYKNVNRDKSIIDKMIYSINEDTFHFNEGDEKYSLEPEFYSMKYIRYRIGKEKKNLIKNIVNNLLNPYKKSEIVSFGKSLSIKLEEDSFDEYANKQINFLYKHRDNIDGEIFILDSKNIDEFFELYNFEESSINFKEKNSRISINIEKLNDKFYKIKLNSFLNNIDYIIGNKRLYIFEFENKIEYIELSNIELKIVDILKDSIILDKKSTISLFAYLQSNLEKIELKTLDKELINELENANVKPEIYCDINDEDDIVIRITTKDENSINYKQISNIFAISKIENLVDIKLDKEIYIEKNSEKDRFLEYLLPNLSKFADVYLTDVIKNINKARKFIFSVGVKVKSNLLELSFNSDELDKNEMIEILKLYKKGKKYYKLKSGDRIVIDKSQFKHIEDIFNDIGIEKLSNIDERKIQIPKFRAYQLNNIESDNFILNKDKKIDALFGKKPLNINERVKAFLRPYQIEGVNWLLKLRAMELGGILADDMGLGKTLQVISYLESIKFENPCLIITPASLIYNWQNEFRKFNSKLNINLISGNMITREEQINTIKKGQIVITTYDYLKRDISKYENIEFDTVVIDEAQNIKNFKTQSSDSVKSIKGEYKIALTGTPIENTLAEIWSIFDFLMPNYLYSYNHFNKYYEKPIIYYNETSVRDRLKKMVEPFILRRLKSKVLKELPDKVEEEFFVKMSEEEKKIYQAHALLAKQEIEEDTNNSKIIILAMLTKLRQLCIDPRLVLNNNTNPSSKIRATMDIIKKAIKNNQKILLFSSFTSVLDLIIEECVKENIRYYQIVGQTSKEKRIKYVEEFQNDDTPLFLISLKSGGTGLNLTKAEVVIHIDPWWNISAQNQATDRAHRIGQENKVQVFNVIVKDSIEEKIVNLQKSKKELSDIFVENSEGSLTKMSKEDIIDLFNME